MEEKPLSSSAELTLPIGDDDFCSFPAIRVDDMRWSSFAVLTCSEGLRRKFRFALVGFLIRDRFRLKGDGVWGSGGVGVDELGNSLASCFRKVSSSGVSGGSVGFVRFGTVVLRRDWAVRISLKASWDSFSGNTSSLAAWAFFFLLLKEN